MKKKAVISVSDKTGIVDFAKGLAAQGYELISTGGTFKTLKEAGVPVSYISEITGFPEILDGRVKTLHPKVHGGILAMDCEEHRKQCEETGIDLIDLVCVNLYPFKETIAQEQVTFAEAIENIDIGGPTMVRSAAKNHSQFIDICPPNLRGIRQMIRTSEQELPGTTAGIQHGMRRTNLVPDHSVHNTARGKVRAQCCFLPFPD